MNVVHLKQNDVLRRVVILSENFRKEKVRPKGPGGPGGSKILVFQLPTLQRIPCEKYFQNAFVLK